MFGVGLSFILVLCSAEFLTWIFPELLRDVSFYYNKYAWILRNFTWDNVNRLDLVYGERVSSFWEITRIIVQIESVLFAFLFSVILIFLRIEVKSFENLDRTQSWACFVLWIYCSYSLFFDGSLFSDPNANILMRVDGSARVVYAIFSVYFYFYFSFAFLTLFRRMRS